MEENFFISKTRSLPPSQDYHFLRREGLKYIEQLGHQQWTDYNSHDPGITMLEALCFALTELGYRAGFDIKDLLATADGTLPANQAFFTAREIFTVNPLTVEDYRKLLADLDGVHNAFLLPPAHVDTLAAGAARDNIPRAEVAIYPDCQQDALVYTQTHHEAVAIRGLYHILLDLDYSDEFGDLNAGNIVYGLTAAELFGVEIVVILPRWKEADYALLQQIYLLPVKALQVTKKASGWEVKATFEVSGTDKTFSYPVRIALRQPVEDLEAKVEAELNKAGIQADIIALYYRKLEKVRSILLSAHRALQAHRNLGEDFSQIDTVIPVEIALCADIEAEEQADLEQVLAEVYFQVEEYLNPDIRFYSLREMLEKNIPVEEVFEGPPLRHGFIDTQELIDTQLRRQVLVSDIINLIMDIKGVVAVKNVLLTEYDQDGNPKLPSQKWCLQVPLYHKPVLSLNRSKILFFKDSLPFRANSRETRDILAMLRGANERAKLKGHDPDLPIPQGQYYQLDEYLTVQYELPQTYGLSPEGLSDTVSEERKAQALQLKAYLLFYDQVMGNYFSQLHHLKDIFSTDAGIRQTYFAQYFSNSDIKDIEKVYRDGPALKQVLSAPAPGETAAQAQERYALLESSESNFYRRRHQFLDHLLARFAESFNDYVLMLYAVEGDKQVKITREKLVADKIRFIQDYPLISSQRGKAFDYLAPSWNTGNVSGLEKRLARLTGIQDFNRRDLFCFPEIKIIPSGSKFTFRVEEAAKTYLEALKEYDTAAEAELVLNKVYDSIARRERYKLDKTNPAKIYVKLLDAYATEVAVSAKFFLKEETAQEFIHQVSGKFKATCEAEGIFLIEHLLLRPRFAVTALSPETPEEKYQLLPVCLAKDCQFCGEEDPYSFRLSVIMPFWPERFRDMNFRKFFEKTVHTETPAHLAAKVCWVNYTTMLRLQTLYREWLDALQDYAADLIRSDELKKDRYREANNQLIQLLAAMHSEYPEARLHDCETGVTNPVRLDQTTLGTF